MWKSVLGRVVQSRSIVTTSHNFFNNKGPSFSDTEYSAEKPRYERKRRDFSETNKRDMKFEKNNGNRERRSTFEQEERHVSFDSARGGSDYPARSYEKYNRGDNFSNQRKERNGGFGEDDRRNANLSPIGTPGKWKVGSGFVEEADRLRSKVRTQNDFSKLLSKSQKAKKDPGVRRQARALEEFSDPNRFPREEEFDEEVDVMKFEKLYDKSQQTRSEVKEMIKLKMVQKKYFKDNNSKENTLSWSDKEHIRYLHNSDPQQWTFELIAEQFRIDPQVAKAVATAKWIPKKPKSTEGIPINAEEIYPLANVNEEQNNEPQKTKHFSKDKKPMTWQELRESMGESEDVINSAKHSEPARVEPEELVDKNIIFQYLSHGSPVKWASDNSKTEPKSKEDVNIFFHDNGTENQPPAKDGEVVDATTIDKRGDVYQKGDSFYSADGELLYRVPGLAK